MVARKHLLDSNGYFSWAMEILGYILFSIATYCVAYCTGNNHLVNFMFSLEIVSVIVFGSFWAVEAIPRYLHEKSSFPLSVTLFETFLGKSVIGVKPVINVCSKLVRMQIHLKNRITHREEIDVVVNASTGIMKRTQAYLHEHPNNSNIAYRLVGIYFTQIVGLVDAYDKTRKFFDWDVDTSRREAVLSTLKSLNAACEKELNRLISGDLMEFDASLKTINQMLSLDGTSATTDQTLADSIKDKNPDSNIFLQNATLSEWKEQAK